jgi:hypothetical protein
MSSILNVELKNEEYYRIKKYVKNVVWIKATGKSG